MLNKEFIALKIRTFWDETMGAGRWWESELGICSPQPRYKKIKTEEIKKPNINNKN
jgi:hypothetical protein